MKIIETGIDGLLIIEPQVFGDDRGYFFESFNKKKWLEVGLPTDFVQENCSRSAKGVLRGLHCQVNPEAQGKLVRCTRGRLWDVAVDVREGSSTYGEWYGLELSEESKKSFWIPAGFLHGFYALEDCDMVYKVVGGNYSPEHDRSVKYDDPAIGVDWPIEGQPTLSEKDQNAKLLSETELNFSL